MQPHDYRGRMRDSEVVAAIVAGDPEGLAKAYDKYAAPLYTYCRSLLHEPADAADAVQDTFVIAATRLDGLRDRERLRPWLYAVARNECRRRLRSKAATTALEEAPDVTDETADVGSDAERAELRALLRDASLGLNPAEQEVVELQLRQGLDASEVADVLGISRNHAHALISRARDQLEICLGVLLVARTGREDCAELDALLQDWDGQLTVLMRKRLHRHIDRCSICGDRKRSVLRPAMLLGLAPLAALPASSGIAPAGLRDKVLQLASSSKPDAVAHRAEVAGRTGPFSEHGFPKPLDPPKSHWWQARSAQAAGVAAGVAVVAVAAVAIASSGNHPEQTASGVSPTVTTGTPGQPGDNTPGNNTPGQKTPGHSTPGQPGASGEPGASGQPGATGGPGASGQPGATGQPSQGTQASSPAATSPVTTPASTKSTPPSRSPTAAPTGSATKSTAPSPSPTRPSPSPTSAPAVTPGTIAVSPATIALSLLGSSTLTITASGGPVSWSISEPSSLIGKVNVSAASGTLQAGQSAKVSITVDGLASVDSTLTVNPGGHAVTVVLGVL
jgi:RNA polymerase sigma factor (sigma-70 family)